MPDLFEGLLSMVLARHGQEPFFALFSASGKPLHGSFYSFADWSGFAKCMKPFTVQCMKTFTVVSAGFSQYMRSFTIARGSLRPQGKSFA